MLFKQKKYIINADIKFRLTVTSTFKHLIKNLDYIRLLCLELPKDEIPGISSKIEYYFKVLRDLLVTIEFEEPGFLKKNKIPYTKYELEQQELWLNLINYDRFSKKPNKDLFYNFAHTNNVAKSLNFTNNSGFYSEFIVDNYLKLKNEIPKEINEYITLKSYNFFDIYLVISYYNDHYREYTLNEYTGYLSNGEHVLDVYYELLDSILKNKIKYFSQVPTYIVKVILTTLRDYDET